MKMRMGLWTCFSSWISGSHSKKGNLSFQNVTSDFWPLGFFYRVNDEDDSEEEIRSAFQAYDTNGDGYITKDEMVKVIWSLIALKLINFNGPDVIPFSKGHHKDGICGK